MPISGRDVRVAIYGAGNFANHTHLPNLQQRLEGVQVVALCDLNAEARKATAARFGIHRTYEDAHEMLAQEEIDALYSIVPAYARTDVEVMAAQRGIHLFSEKPQAIRIETARQIDAAIRQAGVLSTVGFRERYRPLFQQARQLLQERAVYHLRFQMAGPEEVAEALQTTWHSDLEKGVARAIDWGVHAVDCLRFITGLDFAQAQSFYCRPPSARRPLSWSFNFLLSNGGTANLTFIGRDAPTLQREPWFTLLYEGGELAIYGYERIELNGETVYRAEDFDPWLAQTRAFIEAVRSGDGHGLLNDYHDGLYTLAPILAGWESARRGGERLDVLQYLWQG